MAYEHKIFSGAFVHLLSRIGIDVFPKVESDAIQGERAVPKVIYDITTQPKSQEDNNDTSGKD
jgi:hypothetical protein